MLVIIMEEFDVIDNYPRHGDYPIGITKDQTCEDNVEITTSSTKASCITRRKPTLHLCCMIAPSMAVFHMSFRCRLRTSTDWPRCQSSSRLQVHFPVG